MIELKSSIYRYRYNARVIVEAATPLAIGSGESSMQTNRLIVRDANGLPYLPGTSIAGVLRHAMEAIDEKSAKLYFGHQSGHKAFGSRLIFTEGRMLNALGGVVDGARVLPADPICNRVRELPIRQHVRINKCGTALKGGKFDEQIVPKGLRFCFELEMLAENEDQLSYFDALIAKACSMEFRLGGGTRNGLGELKPVKLWRATTDLCNTDERSRYLIKSSDLEYSKDWEGWNHIDTLLSDEHSTYDEYILRLKPRDFYFFGSGIGDKEIDDAPLSELFVKWDEENNTASIVTSQKIVPAASLKGIISHRVAYYYNKNTRAFAGSGKEKTGSENLAVATLFGVEGDDNGNGRTRGKILFTDLIEEEALQTKVFNHVSISQFTGGARAGKLYDEKTVYSPDSEFNLKVLVPKEGIGEEVRRALHEAMRDICKSRLPLGGMTNRGHGMFSGDLLINDEPFDFNTL